jgi:hypothetical protein
MVVSTSPCMPHPENLDDITVDADTGATLAITSAFPIHASVEGIGN